MRKESISGWTLIVCVWGARDGENETVKEGHRWRGEDLI